MPKFLTGNSLAFLPGSTIPYRQYMDEKHNSLLDILMENMGRVNYGPELYDYKGITKSVLLGLQEIHGWEMFSIELKDLSKISYKYLMKT